MPSNNPAEDLLSFYFSKADDDAFNQSPRSGDRLDSALEYGKSSLTNKNTMLLVLVLFVFVLFVIGICFLRKKYMSFRQACPRGNYGNPTGMPPFMVGDNQQSNWCEEEGGPQEAGCGPVLRSLGLCKHRRHRKLSKREKLRKLMQEIEQQEIKAAAEVTAKEAAEDVVAGQEQDELVSLD